MCGAICPTQFHTTNKVAVSTASRRIPKSLEVQLQRRFGRKFRRNLRIKTQNIMNRCVTAQKRNKLALIILFLKRRSSLDPTPLVSRVKTLRLKSKVIELLEKADWSFSSFPTAQCDYHLSQK